MSRKYDKKDLNGIYISQCSFFVEASWNVMAHAQKPDLVFRRNGLVHLNRRGRQFSRLLAAEVRASAVVMLYTPCSEVVWRCTGYPLNSPVSPSFHLPCVTVCHHISVGVYLQMASTSYCVEICAMPAELNLLDFFHQFCIRSGIRRTKCQINIWLFFSFNLCTGQPPIGVMIPDTL